MSKFGTVETQFLEQTAPLFVPRDLFAPRLCISLCVLVHISNLKLHILTVTGNKASDITQCEG